MVYYLFISEVFYLPCRSKTSEKIELIENEKDDRKLDHCGYVSCDSERGGVGSLMWKSRKTVMTLIPVLRGQVLEKCIFYCAC